MRGELNTVMNADQLLKKKKNFYEGNAIEISIKRRYGLLLRNGETTILKKDDCMHGTGCIVTQSNINNHCRNGEKTTLIK